MSKSKFDLFKVQSLKFQSLELSTINRTGNGLSSISDIFAESLQLQTSVLHQSVCILKTGLSISYDGWTKYEVKVPDMLDTNQTVRKHVIPTSNLHNFKIYSSKECRKTSQR